MATNPSNIVRKIFTCTFCNKEYKTRSGLKYHARICKHKIVNIPVSSDISNTIIPVTQETVSDASTSFLASSPKTDLLSVKVAPFGCVPNDSVLRTSASELPSQLVVAGLRPADQDIITIDIDDDDVKYYDDDYDGEFPMYMYDTSSGALFDSTEEDENDSHYNLLDASTTFQASLRSSPAHCEARASEYSSSSEMIQKYMSYTADFDIPIYPNFSGNGFTSEVSSGRAPVPCRNVSPLPDDRLNMNVAEASYLDIYEQYIQHTLQKTATNIFLFAYFVMSIVVYFQYMNSKPVFMPTVPITVPIVPSVTVPTAIKISFMGKKFKLPWSAEQNPATPN